MVSLTLSWSYLVQSQPTDRTILLVAQDPQPGAAEEACRVITFPQGPELRIMATYNAGSIRFKFSHSRSLLTGENDL